MTAFFYRLIQIYKCKTLAQINISTLTRIQLLLYHTSCVFLPLVTCFNGNDSLVTPGGSSHNRKGLRVK